MNFRRRWRPLLTLRDFRWMIPGLSFSPPFPRVVAVVEANDACAQQSRRWGIADGAPWLGPDALSYRLCSSHTATEFWIPVPTVRTLPFLSGFTSVLKVADSLPRLLSADTIEPFVVVGAHKPPSDAVFVSTSPSGCGFRDFNHSSCMGVSGVPLRISRWVTSSKSFSLTCGGSSY